MRRTVLVLASVALAVLFFMSIFWSIPGSTPTAAQTTPTKPNFVFILTDDMRMDDLAYMPNTSKFIASEGMTFNNAYVPLASCCPSRASILRGQYVHNHKVWYSDVHSPIGGYQGWVAPGHESDNLATRLQAGGYSTGLFGKYMNGYGKTTGKPPGWTDWFAMNGGEGYYNYSVNDNGVTKNFGSTADDYFMDVLNTESQQFIQQSVTDGKPFFLYLSPKVPHLPSIPAPRYVNAFNGEPAPKLPSYNEEKISDKPPWISSLPIISSTEAAAIQDRHENRVESLQAVDEAVQDIVDKLSATGQLSNTYIVFTSDNGWQHGEHRIPRNKFRPYEESSHMPLLVRGPGVEKGSSVDGLVTFPDFMPTFLDLGGVAQPTYIDGRSFEPLLHGTASSWRTAILLEGRELGSPEQDYFAIRTADGVKYIEYGGGFKEYYDLSTDPFEETSTPGSAPASLVDRLHRLETCAKATCRSIEDEGGGTPPPSEDTTPPETAIMSGPSGTIPGTTAQFGFSSSETNSLFECKLEPVEAAFSSCGSPKSYSGLSNGSYTFSVQATDAAGNTDLSPATRSFTVSTTQGGDTTPPTVKSTVPAAGATGADRTANVTATFSEDMLAPSITGQTFKLFKKGSTTKIGAKVGYGASTATLDPTNSLQAGVTYKAVVSTGAKDAAGNPLAQQYRWFFTVR